MSILDCVHPVDKVHFVIASVDEIIQVFEQSKKELPQHTKYYDSVIEHLLRIREEYEKSLALLEKETSSCQHH